MDKCPTWKLVDSPVFAKLLLLSALAVTLAIFLRATRIIYRTVEITHPVFAAIFQVCANANCSFF